VLDTTFLYLALVRAAGVCPAVMDELASLSDVSFAYQEDPGGVSNLVSRVASNLLEYEPKYVLSGPSMTLSATQHASTASPTTAACAAGADRKSGANTADHQSNIEEDEVLGIAHAFTPANTIITVALKSYAKTVAAVETRTSSNEQWQTEPWYGTLYREEPISPELLHQWQYAVEIAAAVEAQQQQRDTSASQSTRDAQDWAPVAATVSGTRVWLRPVPLLNRFVPAAEMNMAAAATPRQRVASKEDASSDTSIKSESADKEVPGEVRATRVVSGAENNRLAAWRVSPSKHLLGVPRLHASVHLLTPRAGGSPREVILAKLFCRLLLSDTNTALYDASCAGLTYDVTSTSDGLVLITALET